MVGPHIYWLARTTVPGLPVRPPDVCSVAGGVADVVQGSGSHGELVAGVRTRSLGQYDLSGSLAGHLVSSHDLGGATGMLAEGGQAVGSPGHTTAGPGVASAG